jgi:hypothetical protein
MLLVRLRVHWYVTSIGHGTDHAENTSSVVRMRICWPVTQHWAWRGQLRKHFYCCVRIFRALPRNGSTNHNIKMDFKVRCF